MNVRVRPKPSISAPKSTRCARAHTDIGAIASFVGLARDLNEGSGVQAMTLEHYPGMTEKALAALVDEANARWTCSMRR